MVLTFYELIVNISFVFAFVIFIIPSFENPQRSKGTEKTNSLSVISSAVDPPYSYTFTTLPVTVPVGFISSSIS